MSIFKEPDRHIKRVTKQINLEKIKHIAREQCSVKIAHVKEQAQYDCITLEYYDVDE